MNIYTCRKIAVGEQFGHLTVVGDRIKRGRRAVFPCQCRCGRVVEALRVNLIMGRKRSCGCLVVTHGYLRKSAPNSREYRIWGGMKQRCNNPRSKDYSRYGGRGVKVCPRWNVSFADFMADMGPSPSNRHSLERKNNDGDYEPENCRWATPTEQQNNRRGNHWVTLGRRTQTVCQWSRELGISSSTIYDRLYKGLGARDALRPSGTELSSLW